MKKKRLFFLIISTTLSFLDLQFIFGKPSETLQTIHQLQQELYSLTPSKNTKLLKKAQEQFKNENYKKAKLLANLLQKEDQFFDYGYWIEALSLKKQSEIALKNRKWEESAQLGSKSVYSFLEIITHAPESPLIKELQKNIAQAELLIANAYYFNRKYNHSISFFQKAFQRLENEKRLRNLSHSDYSYFSKSCEKMKTKSCGEWIKKFLKKLPKTSLESQEIRKNYTWSNSIEDSPKKHCIRKLTENYKASDLDFSAFNLAMKNYLNGNISESIGLFFDFLALFPKSVYQSKSRFWLARALEQKGETALAQKHYNIVYQASPLSYYGLLSAKIINQPIEKAIDGILPIADTQDPWLTPLEKTRIERAQMLFADGLDQLAKIELKDITSKETLSSPFLVYLSMLHYRAGNYLNCFQILQELFQRGYPQTASTYNMRLIFPIVFFDVIKELSTKIDVDPILVLSLIKQESAFEESATSPVGAMGLMQLMPATALDINRNSNILEFLNPEKNIQTGVSYLKKLLNYYNNNIILALAAYNAGQKPVDKWLKDFSFEEKQIEWIERIPYHETREYVTSILRNYEWYYKIINHKNSTLVEQLLNGKTKMHNVSITHNVFLPFQAKQASFSNSLFTFQPH